MKKLRYALFVLLCVISTIASAQNIEVERAYTFAKFMVYDANDQLEFNEKVAGVIMFYSENGKEGISISLGSEITYNGFITQRSKDSVNGEIVYSYKFLQSFEGKMVPIVLSEIYTPTISNAVPTKFYLAICNVHTNEKVKSNVFEGISRAR